MSMPNCRSAHLLVQHLNGETLVYDLNDHRAMCLNETSSVVWELCDGTHDTDAIASAASERLGMPVTRPVVELALDKLEERRLLDTRDTFRFVPVGVSRRSAVKAIALGSAVALPVIAALIAPHPANAASCLANDASCTTSSQCCGSCCKAVGGGLNQCKSGGGNCLP